MNFVIFENLESVKENSHILSAFFASIISFNNFSFSEALAFIMIQSLNSSSIHFMIFQYL